MIARAIVPALQKAASQFYVVSLTGPRQSGKTTLLRALLPDYRYVSLENPVVRRFATEDPLGFLRTYDGRVILDEVQRTPELFSYLQTKVDEDRQAGQYILSGSQNFLLSEAISQTLAGRVAVLRLLPLSYAELAGADLLAPTVAGAIHQGGYPALFDRHLPPDNFFPSYTETYVERDVRDLLAVRDLGAFTTFVRLCAGRIGQLLNLSALATECGVTAPTARAWLSLLESSYLVFLLQPYYRNFNKRVTKSPKLYFYDTGLACHLLGIESATQVESYYQRGSLFENAMVAELVKNRLNAGRLPRFYYWQDSHKNEVDLLEETAGSVSLYEMKYTHSLVGEHFKNLHLYRQVSAQEGPSTLLYAGDEDQERTAGQARSWRRVATL